MSSPINKMGVRRRMAMSMAMVMKISRFQGRVSKITHKIRFDRVFIDMIEFSIYTTMAGVETIDTFANM